VKPKKPGLLKTILPIAATAAGTAFGGPIGGALAGAAVRGFTGGGGMIPSTGGAAP
jgi:hypothetical protein